MVLHKLQYKCFGECTLFKYIWNLVFHEVVFGMRSDRIENWFLLPYMVSFNFTWLIFSELIKFSSSIFTEKENLKVFKIYGGFLAVVKE